MRTYTPIILVLTLTLLTGTLFVNSCERQEPQQERQQFAKINEGQTTPELAEYMQYIGGYLHKLSLSVQARNPDLADFYMHELQASVLAVKQDVPGYEGYDIAYFTELLLDSQIDSLRTTLKTRDWDAIRARINTTVNSCNTCHNATGHGFVQVTAGFDKNPYNQVFEPKP
ncbi:MAG: hypothetical protein R3281_15900 [Balneolaceae bacterium]|nr:hypothetical protein [Balneolaceae bacterium]